MFATHKGLSEQYQVSCRELDFLVDSVSANPDVIGARMMGGGFGGCTINMVKENEIKKLIDSISDKYKQAFQQELKTYQVHIEDGTSLIRP